MQSLIRDINLAAEGRKKIDWVSNFMPTLNTDQAESFHSYQAKSQSPDD